MSILLRYIKYSFFEGYTNKLGSCYFNNDDVSIATEVNIYWRDLEGFDKEEALLGIPSQSIFVFQAKEANFNLKHHYKFRVTSLGVVNSNFVTFPITYISGEIPFNDTVIDAHVYLSADGAVAPLHNILGGLHQDSVLSVPLNDLDVLTYDAALLKWTNKPPPSSGEVNDGLNVGGAVGEIFRDKFGVDLNFRTIESTGGNIDIVTNADTVDINVTFPPSGEVNDGINVGEGTGIYKEKLGQTLNFKTLTSNDLSVSIAPSGSDYVDFSVNFPADIDTSSGHKTIYKTLVPTAEGEWYFSGGSFALWDTLEGGVPTTNVGLFNQNTIVVFYSKTTEKFWYLKFGKTITIGNLAGYTTYSSVSNGGITNPFTDGEETYMIVIKSHITDINLIPNVDISGSGDPNLDHRHLKWNNLTNRWVDDYITIPENPADGLQNGLWIDTNTQKMKYKPTGLSEYVVSYQETVTSYDGLSVNYGARNRFKSNDLIEGGGIVFGWTDTGVVGGGAFIPNNTASLTIYNPTGIDGKPCAETILPPTGGQDYQYMLDLGANINTAYTMAFVIQDMTTTTGTYLDFINNYFEDGYNVPGNINPIYVAGGNMQYYFTGQVGSNYGPPPTSATIGTPMLIIFRNENTTSGSFKADFEQSTTVGAHSSTQTCAINARYIRIGSSWSGGLGGVATDFAACKVAEFVFWDRFISDVEVDEISDILLGYYGVRPLVPVALTGANLFIEQLEDVVVTAPVLTGSTLINDGANWVNGKYDYTNLLNTPIEKSCGHITKFVSTAVPAAFGEWGYSAGALRVYKFQSVGIDISYLFTAQGLYWFYSSDTTDNLFAVYQLTKDSTVTDVGPYISISPISVRVGASFDPDTETLLIAQVPNVENLTELLNVNAPNPLDKQTLYFDSGPQQWIPISRATGSLYIQENAISTTLTTQSTFYDITNFTTTFNSGTGVHFSMPSNGRLKYTGTRTINVRVWATISCISSNNDEIHRVRFMREDNLGANTVELQPYQVNAYHTQRFQNTVIIAEYSGLVTNEQFKLQIANMDASTRSIFVRCIQFNIIEI